MRGFATVPMTRFAALGGALRLTGIWRLALIQSCQQDIDTIEDDLPTQELYSFIRIVVAHGLRAETSEYLSQSPPLHFSECMWPIHKAKS
jgi:hypothetical protein